MQLHVTFFQTRAIPQNSHRAIHSLFPDFEEISELSPSHFFKGRLRNTLLYPATVQWVSSFMGEIDVSIVSPVLYDSNMYFARQEWGSNGNIHRHQLQYSEVLSIFILNLKSIIRMIFET